MACILLELINFNFDQLAWLENQLLPINFFLTKKKKGFKLRKHGIRF